MAIARSRANDAPTPRPPGVLRPLLMMAVLLALVAAARSFTKGIGGTGGTGTSDPTSGAAMGAGLALLGGLFAGELFSALRLPKLTGYLCFGMAVGPHGLDLITTRMLGDLGLVNGVAVGLIALTAGLEINFNAVRPRLRAIGMIGGLGIGAALVVVTTASFSLARWMPQFDPAFGLGQRAAVALVTGTVYASVSPSVAIAILTEMGSAGPVSEVAMGVVVLGDIVLIVLFAAVNAVIAGMFTASGADPVSIGTLSFELFGSLGVGVAVGLVLAVYAHRVARKTALFAFGLCFLVAEAGARLHLDPLLVCLGAGLTVENMTSVEGKALAHTLDVVNLPIFAIFFCVAGAGIHLRELMHVAPWAILLGALRASGLLWGGFAGGRLAKAEPMVRAYAPLSLLPQAGISIGLAILIGKQFGGTPDHPLWGARLAELVLGTIAVNELLGPSVLRYALVKAGETGRRDAGPTEHWCRSAKVSPCPQPPPP